MTTTINKREEHRLRRPTRSPEGRYPGERRDHELRTRSLTGKASGMVEWNSNAASPAAAFVSGVKTIAPVLLALVPFALAFGTTATNSGLSTLEAFGMSLLVFSGAAQLAVVPLISSGASVAVIVLTVLVINLRMALYSASLAPHFRGLSAGWKGLISYILTDQAYAATITRFDEGQVAEPDKRWYYLGAAMPMGVVWLTGTMSGVYLGSWASEGWSLDFVLPLTFIALAVPVIKDRTTGAAALTAGGTALLAATMPLNLSLITAALVGIVGGMVAEIIIERSGR